MTIGVEMGAEGENNFKRTTTTTETRECYVFTKLNSYFLLGSQLNSTSQPLVVRCDSMIAF